MTNEATRKEILELLAGGKITADEAAEMLQRPEPTKETPPETEQTPPESETTAVPPEPVPIVDETPIVQLKEQEKEKINGSPAAADKGKPSWLRVRVADLETGKNKVSVNIPLRLVKFGFNIASQFTPELSGVDVNELKAMMESEEGGLLMDVMDEEDNEHVQIFIE